MTNSVPNYRGSTVDQTSECVPKTPTTMSLYKFVGPEDSWIFEFGTFFQTPSPPTSLFDTCVCVTLFTLFLLIYALSLDDYPSPTHTSSGHVCFFSSTLTPWTSGLFMLRLCVCVGLKSSWNEYGGEPYCFFCWCAFFPQVFVVGFGNCIFFSIFISLYARRIELWNPWVELAVARAITANLTWRSKFSTAWKMNSVLIYLLSKFILRFCIFFRLYDLLTVWEYWRES